MPPLKLVKRIFRVQQIFGVVQILTYYHKIINVTRV